MSEERGLEDCLPPGTELLRGQYIVERFLNAGGFGVTYLARDSLERRVVIKECFPTTMCCRSQDAVKARSRVHQAEFDSVVRLFGQEARRLAQLAHPNIVGVHDVFEDLGTAFMALDYVEGRDLLDIIEEEPDRLNPAQVQAMTLKLLDAIDHVHSQGILHRDISPDNILLDQDDEPVLIDFGAARDTARTASRVLSAIRVVKDGYSPQEFYLAGTEQTPASDLYSLGATLHHVLTGTAPPYCQLRLAAMAERRADPYTPLAGQIGGYSRGFIAAIDKSLNIFARDRVQSADDWGAMIGWGDNAVAPSRDAATATARAQAPAQARAQVAPDSDETLIASTIHQLVEETNVVVRAEQDKARRAAEEEAKELAVAQKRAEERRLRILEEARREAEEAAEIAELSARRNHSQNSARIEPSGDDDTTHRRGWLARLFSRSRSKKSPANIAAIEGIES